MIRQKFYTTNPNLFPIWDDDIPCNPTKSLCRWKIQLHPAPFYPAPFRMKSRGLLWVTRLTSPTLKVTMVIRGQFEPQQSSLSKSMTESSGHHSCKTTGKTSPDIYKWREETLKQKEIARERKETRLKLTYRSVQLNKERAWFQKMKGFNINPL